MKLRDKLFAAISLISLGFILTLSFIVISYNRIESMNNISRLAMQAVSDMYRLRFETKTLYFSIADTAKNQDRWASALAQLERDLDSLRTTRGTQLMSESLALRVRKVMAIWNLMRDKYGTSAFLLAELLGSQAHLDLEKASIVDLIQEGMRGRQYEGFGISRWSTLKDTLSFIELASNDFQIVLVGMSNDIQVEVSRNTRLTLLAAGLTSLVVLLCAVVFVLIFSRTLAAKVRRVEGAIHRIAAGDFSVDLDMRGNDEFGRLAGNFRVFKEELRNKINSILDMKIILGNTAQDGIDLDRVLDILLESSMHKTGADAGAVFLMDDRKQALGVRRCRGFFPPVAPLAEGLKGTRNNNILHQAFLDASLKPGETVIGEVASNGEPLYIKEVPADGRLPQNAREGPLFISSLIGAPFVRGKSILGVLALIKREAGKTFSDLDALYLNTFADFASLTIENNHKYDEIYHLTQINRYSQSELKELKRNNLIDRNVVKTYFLRKLIINSADVSDEEFTKARQDGILEIAITNYLSIGLFLLDRAAPGQAGKADIPMPELIQVIQSAFSSSYPHEIVEIRPDAAAIVLSADGSDPTVRTKLATLVGDVQRRVLAKFARSVSCLLGERIESIRALSAGCNNLLNLSAYRFLFGRGCVITEERIRENLANQKVEVSDAARGRLEKGIREERLEVASEALAAILAEIASMSYNSVHISLIRLVGVIEDAFDQSRSHRLNAPRVNFNLIYQELMEQVTFQEISVLLQGILREIIESKGVEAKRKNEILIDAIKDLIGKSYFEPDLCLKQVAATLKMSSMYLGKLFKSGTKLSVQSYINEVRLGKAVEFLESSGQSVGRIIEQVGMDNESYFYKLFRQKYGTTPKEFITARGLQVRLGKNEKW
ncbi:MAG: helix-turn-helix domain-containing protein [Rectinemataceae bacterium]|jgi:AraC-like DNA-binding protein/HAMP domain-containing protein